MGHSLLNRFQGGLLGSAIAGFRAGDGEVGPVTLSLLECLIGSGWLSPADWQQICRRHPEILAKKPGELAATLLPLALFFHDAPWHLTEQLQACWQIWQLPTEIFPEIQIWCRALALALQEKLQAAQPLPQLLQGNPSIQNPPAPLANPPPPLPGGEPRGESKGGIQNGMQPSLPSALRQQLEQVDRCLQQGTPLAQALATFVHPSSNQGQELAAALYCFASTPEDFRLSTLRAATTGLAGAASLTGALAGVYNSASAIPVSWLLPWQGQPTARLLLEQSRNLFAVWAGNYQRKADRRLATMAIAAAGTIQPRPSLRLISRKNLD